MKSQTSLAARNFRLQEWSKMIERWRYRNGAKWFIPVITVRLECQ